MENARHRRAFPSQANKRRSIVQLQSQDQAQYAGQDGVISVAAAIAVAMASELVNTLDTNSPKAQLFGAVVGLSYYFFARMFGDLAGVYKLDLAVANIVPPLLLMAGGTLYLVRSR